LTLGGQVPGSSHIAERGETVFSVIETGVGIAPAELRHVSTEVSDDEADIVATEDVFSHGQRMIFPVSPPASSLRCAFATPSSPIRSAIRGRMTFPASNPKSF